MIFPLFLTGSPPIPSQLSSYFRRQVEMDLEKKVQFEKFAALLALEAQNGQIDTKKELESRVNLLSPPLTGRHFHFPNIQKEVEGLIQTSQNGRGKTFKLTTKGKRALYEGRHNQSLLKLLGRSIRSIGDQFSSYGRIAERLKVKNITDEVPLESFVETLDEGINRKTRASGWAKIEDVQDYVCSELHVPQSRFSEMCRKAIENGSNGSYKFAPGRKGEKITFNGKAYGLIRRVENR